MEKCYKPNDYEWTVLREFLYHNAKQVAEFGNAREGINEIYHFLGSTVRLYLKPSNTLEVIVTSDNNDKEKEVFKRLKYQLKIKENQLKRDKAGPILNS